MEKTFFHMPGNLLGHISDPRMPNQFKKFGMGLGKTKGFYIFLYIYLLRWDASSTCSTIGWDLLDGKSEYESQERVRRMAAVKWFSLAICLSAFVIYGFVAA